MTDQDQIYSLPTDIGAAKLSYALSTNGTVNIVGMAIGDGGGQLVEPDASWEALANEVHRAQLNQLYQHADNPNWLVAELVLPAEVGGWTIRELMLYDDAGDAIFIGNHAEQYKPVQSQGSDETKTIRMVILVSDVATLTLKTDPTTVLATIKFVNDAVAAHKQAAEAHADSQITISQEIPQAPAATSVSQALAALGAFAADGFQNLAVFDTAGDYTWQVPDVLRSGRRKAWVTVIGGGGGGRSSSGHCGGGGGGGISRDLIDLTGIESVAITVGAGGAGDVNGSGKMNGAASSFGAFISASGGLQGTSFSVGGRGGMGVGGAFNSSLGDAGWGGTSSSKGGSGGGPGGHGGSGSTDTIIDGNGADGHWPGGGGGGGDGSSSRAGGSGADGGVIIQW